MRRRLLLALPLLAPRPARAETLDAIERDSGGRLGVAAWRAGGGQPLLRRADERFPMASTVKAPLGAMVLAHGPAVLDRTFAVPAALVPWSPVTEGQAGRAMTGAALLAAMLEASDNTATNLLLDAVGGPAALTAWLNDGTTRLDRPEPALNEARPGDPRDTTTPRAMAALLERLALREPFGAALLAGMRAHRFGGALLRAGMPGWALADRTGAGGFGSRGAIAIATPPGGGAPWVIAAYLHDGPRELAARDALLARVGAAIAALA